MGCGSCGNETAERSSEGRQSAKASFPDSREHSPNAKERIVGALELVAEWGGQSATSRF